MSVTFVAGTPEIPTLLDESTLADLYSDFASTGDLPHLAELVRGFLDRGATQLNTIAAAVQVGDAEAIRRAAHKLKGSSRTLGAALLGAVAARIECAAVEGDVPAARRAVPELESVFAQSRTALSERVAAFDDADRAA